VRTLVVALRGEARLHVIRLGKSSNAVGGGGGAQTGVLVGLFGAGRPPAEYIGHVDMSHLAPSRGLAAAAPAAAAGPLPPPAHTPAATAELSGGGAPAAPAAKSSGAGEIRCLAWDPTGTRLLIGWGGAAHGGVTVLATRVSPTLQLHTIGNLTLPWSSESGNGAGGGGPPATAPPTLKGLAFAAAVGPTGGAVGGIVLSMGWDDGHVTLLPLLSS